MFKYFYQEMNYFFELSLGILIFLRLSFTDENKHQHISD
jgi:hypothetical protein